MQRTTMAPRSPRGSRASSYRRLAARLTTACAAFAACTIVAAASELPLQRVIVSTSGLAQFTYSGTAAPGDKIDLSVRLDQVDDILKSLTVFDREGALGERASCRTRNPGAHSGDTFSRLRETLQ